ncbi:MAG: substrate-binding domain-containing protein [Oscillospiraceae bacterium]|nr:substrate-binding domain-containing protein [Oscillospiraceae bacterium]
MKFNRKKFLTMILSLAMIAVLFTGCSTSSNNSSSGKFHADVFYYNYADAYISTVRDAMNKRLDALGISYTNYDGKGDQATQTNDINTALSKGTNLLIVNIVDNASADTANGIVSSAAAKNVPVVFFNREPSSADVFATAGAANASSTAFVGTNYVQAGYLEGQMIANYLLNSANLNGKNSKFDLDNDGKIAYAMFRGQMDNNEAIARTLYSVLTANIMLKQAGVSFQLTPSTLNVTNNDTSTSNPPNGWTYNYNGTSMDIAAAITQNGFNPLAFYSVDKDSSWSSANANAMLQTMHSTDGNCFSNGKIELIICNNDDMAMGCISFLNTVNYNTGSGSSYIPVFGVDATATARTKISDGSMTGSIEQSNVAMAQMVITVAMNVAAKDSNICDIGTIPLTVDGANKNMVRIPYGIVTAN